MSDTAYNNCLKTTEKTTKNHNTFDLRRFLCSKISNRCPPISYRRTKVTTSVVINSLMAYNTWLSTIFGSASSPYPWTAKCRKTSSIVTHTGSLSFSFLLSTHASHVVRECSTLLCSNVYTIRAHMQSRSFTYLVTLPLRFRFRINMSVKLAWHPEHASFCHIRLATLLAREEKVNVK